MCAYLIDGYVTLDSFDIVLDIVANMDFINGFSTSIHHHQLTEYTCE